MAAMTRADPRAKGQSEAEELSFNLLHKSGKTFELLHFREPGADTAGVRVLPACGSQSLSVTSMLVMSHILAGDQGLLCRVLHSTLFVLAQGDYLGKSAVIPLTYLGKLIVSLITAGRACVFNAASTGASGKPALVSKGPHKQ